ncbi:MAG: hypothetical protein WC624_06070 [Candidatus Margulisiibacteriota bacterium]
MNRPLVISICLLAVFMGGCSKTITTIPTYGSQMIVEAVFQGNIDTAKTRYFLIISTQESYSFPILPPEGTSLDEFLEPGDSPVVGNIADYFTKYYSTWSSYIALDSLGYHFVSGPFSATTPITKETLGAVVVQSNYIYFTVSLNRLFGSSVPDNIYFDIISADYPSNGQKYLKDHIAPPSRSISKIAGSILEKTDEAKPDIDPSQDIISWSVKIE